jgi:hypothetical protein
VADSGTGSPAGTFDTSSTDSVQVFATGGAGKPITDLRDYNRDGQVNSTDSVIVFANGGTIQRINIAGGGPFAPEADPAVGVAQALAATVPSGLPKVPGWLTSRLGSVDLNTGKVADLFTKLAEVNTPGTRSILLAANQVTNALGLDDTLLESLIADLGL